MTGHLTPPELHELSDGCLAYVQSGLRPHVWLNWWRVIPEIGYNSPPVQPRDGIVRARLVSDLRMAKTQPTMTAVEKINH